MEKSQMNANFFELKSDSVRVTYSSQGNAGQPTLTYQDPDLDKTYQASEIRLVDSDIGQLVTVTLLQGTDQGTTMFTTIVPTVNVAQAASPVTINTKAVVTTFPKVVGSNLSGPDQTYRVESLHGTAQFRFVREAATPAASLQAALN